MNHTLAIWMDLNRWNFRQTQIKNNEKEEWNKRRIWNKIPIWIENVRQMLTNSSETIVKCEISAESCLLLVFFVELNTGLSKNQRIKAPGTFCGKSMRYAVFNSNWVWIKSTTCRMKQKVHFFSWSSSAFSKLHLIWIFIHLNKSTCKDFSRFIDLRAQSIFLQSIDIDIYAHSFETTNTLASRFVSSTDKCKQS